MTAEQEAIYNMYRDTFTTGSNNQTFVDTIPAMKQGFIDLGKAINNISGLSSLQAQVLSGIAVDKNKLKAKMANLQYNYSGPGRAWAATNNDDTTYNAINISFTKVDRARDDQAGPISQNVYDILNANAAALVPFGLDAAQIGELLAAINDYTAIVPLPSNAVNLRQTYKTKIEDEIKTTSALLERVLDNLIRGQINNEPDFASTYFNSREIIDPPTQSTTFNILVLDDATGNPIGNAKAEAVGLAKFTFTDDGGKCSLKQFRKGFYNILVTADTYNPSQQDNIHIGLGETKDLTFRLIKTP